MKNIFEHERTAIVIQDSLITSAVPGTLGGAAMAVVGSFAMARGLKGLREATNQFEVNRAANIGKIGVGMAAVGSYISGKAGNDLFDRLNERLNRR